MTFYCVITVVPSLFIWRGISFLLSIIWLVDYGHVTYLAAAGTQKAFMLMLTLSHLWQRSNIIYPFFWDKHRGIFNLFAIAHWKEAFSSVCQLLTGNTLLEEGDKSCLFAKKVGHYPCELFSKVIVFNFKITASLYNTLMTFKYDYFRC